MTTFEFQKPPLNFKASQETDASETPRCDAACHTDEHGVDVVDAVVARALERELFTARQAAFSEATRALTIIGVGSECGECGFRYWQYKGHIIRCPRCELAEAKDDVTRLHREKMGLLFGPDGQPCLQVREAIESAVKMLAGFYGTGAHSLDHKIYREQLEKVALLAASNPRSGVPSATAGDAATTKEPE